MRKSLTVPMAALLLSSCGKPVGTPHCRFGPEHLVTRASGAGFDGLALGTPGAGSETGQRIAVWSDRSGLWWRRLSRTGRPIGPPERLGPHCGGGLALASPDRTAASQDMGMLVACLELPREQSGKPGRVTLLWLDRALRVQRRALFGTVGPESRGVALAVSAGGPVVAWHEGSAARDRIWLAEIEDAGRVEGHPVSRDQVEGSGPSLFVDGGRWLAAWEETVVDAQGDVVGEVMVYDGRGAARKVATVMQADATPVLARDSRGLLVAYRDQVRTGNRSSLFIRRLSEHLSPLGDPEHIGRADGLGGPSVLTCGRDLYAVAPRSYGRREVLVAINLLSPGLRRRVGERQIYQVGADFSRAAASCAAGGLLLLIGERGAASSDTVRLMSTRLDCR